MSAPENPWRVARDAARTRADALGLPTTALEDWRQVRVAALSTAIPAATPIDDLALKAAIAQWRLPDLPLAVLVNGVLQPALSDAPAWVRPLSALPAVERDALLTRWLTALPACDVVGECWSLADCAGGLHLTPTADAPSAAAPAVQILALSTGGSHGCRIVITVPRAVAAQIVVQHVALAATPARTCVTVEATVADGATLTLDELVRGADDARQLLTTTRATLGRDARCHWATATCGGALVRQRVLIELNGANAEADLSATALLSDARQAHVFTRVLHRVGHTRSRQLIKTASAERSLAGFDGVVTIAVGADGSDAEQQNHNLLLSPNARAETRPQLDIHADEVQAKHGATVGRLDAEQQWYMRARGLSVAQADALLLRGFLNESLARFGTDAARAIAVELLP